MVIISYYLKVCLSPGFPLARSPGSGLAARPVYSLASCYCFCRSVSMNSPFRVRLRARAPASASPRPGLPAVPVAPSFRLGVQKYIFFSNRQTFSQKFFEIFKKQRPLLPAHHSYTPIKEMRSDASPQTKPIHTQTFAILSHQSALHDRHQSAFHR